MKIVFFGTSSVGLPILTALRAKHIIALVVTTPDAAVGRKQLVSSSPIAQYATANNIPVLKPSTVKNNVDFIQTLTEQQADIFIVVSYGKILPPELINIPPLKTLNVHFSLLPQYRGASPIQGALLNGDSETGTTIFILDAHMDTGPIIAQRRMALEPDDTFTDVASKLSHLSAQLLLEVLPDYSAGNIVPTPQDSHMATYVSLIQKQDGKVDWNDTASNIYNRYRAFVEWPGVWTTWNGKKLKILKCQPVAAMGAMDSGQVVHNSVGCGQQTALELQEVQLEGKKAMDMDVFLRGHQQFVNTTLGT